MANLRASDGIADTEFSIIKGDEGLNGRLQYTATLDPAVKFAPSRGRVMQLTANNTFKTGMHPNLPGMFLIDPYSQPTTSNPGTTSSGRFIQKAALPSGKMTCLIASRSYIVESSSFAQTNYVHGEPLTAIAADTDETTGGLVTNTGSGKDGRVKKYEDAVIGCVIGQPKANHNGVKVLKFVTGWFPAKATN
ncbi:MAG: hypothetical protein QM811_19920 [Pirellulales bacterium]